MHTGMKISTNWNNFALHYTKGKGFYETIKRMLSLVGLTNSNNGTTTE
jgi:hypothetical protein